jgi:hypothetical protein
VVKIKKEKKTLQLHNIGENQTPEATAINFGASRSLNGNQLCKNLVMIGRGAFSQPTPENLPLPLRAYIVYTTLGVKALHYNVLYAGHTLRTIKSMNWRFVKKLTVRDLRLYDVIAIQSPDWLLDTKTSSRRQTASFTTPIQRNPTPSEKHRACSVF